MSKTIHLANSTVTVGISNATAGYLWAKGVIIPTPDAVNKTATDNTMPADYLIPATAMWTSPLVEVLLGGVPTDPNT